MDEPRKTSFLHHPVTRLDALGFFLGWILMDALEAAAGETAATAFGAVCFVALLVLIWVRRQRRDGDAC